MEVSCPHCNTKARPEVIAVADLSCTICASCKAVLSTRRDAAPAPLNAPTPEPVKEAELVQEFAPLPVFEAPAPEVFEAPAPEVFEVPAHPFVPPPPQFEDVLALPDERDEATPGAPARDYVLEVEEVFVAPPEPAAEPELELLAAPEPEFAPEFAAEPAPEPETAAPFVAPEPEGAAPVAFAAAEADAEQQSPQVFAVEEADAAESPKLAVMPPPAPVPDGYAVGLRVMRIAPVWLLLSSVGFLSILLLLSWASQPIPQTVAVAAQPSAQAQRNEASNNSPIKPQAPVLPAERPAQPAQPAQQAQPEAPAQPAPAAQPAQPAPQAAPQPAAQPAAPAQPAQPKPLEGGKFAVQVASFKDASEANERVSQLRAAGFDAEAVAVEIPNRGLWHRVICGRARTREEASSLGAQLRSKGAVKEVMITELSK